MSWLKKKRSKIDFRENLSSLFFHSLNSLHLVTNLIFKLIFWYDSRKCF